MYNLAIRFIFNITKYERASITSLCDELRWRTAKNCRLYFKLNLVRNIISFQRPSYLYNHLKLPDDTLRRSRHNIPNLSLLNSLPLNFVVPSFREHRTLLFDNSFIVSTTKHWNNLPPALKTLP